MIGLIVTVEQGSETTLNLVALGDCVGGIPITITSRVLI